MTPEEAISKLRSVKAFVHDPKLSYFDVVVALDTLDTYVQRSSKVVEKARANVCKDPTCGWGLCRTVAELDGKRSPE